MTCHKVLRSILAVTFVAACALVGCAQRPAPASSGGVTPLAGTPVAVTGKIGYMTSARAYVVQGEAPPDVLFIVNADHHVLDELMKSGKTVTVEGHYTARIICSSKGLMAKSIEGRSKCSMKDDFAYKCECGRLIKIDDEYEDFFVGHGKGMKRAFLVGTCPGCGRNSLLTPDDFGKLYHIYTGATFEFR